MAVVVLNFVPSPVLPRGRSVCDKSTRTTLRSSKPHLDSRIAAPALFSQDATMDSSPNGSQATTVRPLLVLVSLISVVRDTDYSS